jgi:phosphate:Na+ symporter
MAKSAEELNTKGISFSPFAREELKRIIAAVYDIYNMALDAYETGDMVKVMNIGPLRIVVSEMCDAYKASHVERLAQGICTAEQGFVFNDILYSCGRIADHSMNIAAIVYRFSSVNQKSGAYMHDFKQRKDNFNEESYRAYYDKYVVNEI